LGGGVRRVVRTVGLDVDPLPRVRLRAHTNLSPAALPLRQVVRTMDMLRKVTLLMQCGFGCGDTDPMDAPNPVRTMFSIRMFSVQSYVEPL
jgi:hypothetical protein